MRPGVPTLVEIPLQDLLHTFRAGHRIQIQVQSTWFPLVDRNPQKFVKNIFRARADDYVAAEHRLWRTHRHPTHVEIAVLPADR
jgi:predicted acyl esterase